MGMNTRKPPAAKKENTSNMQRGGMEFAYQNRNVNAGQEGGSTLEGVYNALTGKGNAEKPKPRMSGGKTTR